MKKKNQDHEAFFEENIDGMKSMGKAEIAKTKARNQSMKEKKEARFTARLNGNDFEALKEVAAKSGIGYQTLLGSVIHRFVIGELVDVSEVRKVIPGLKVKKAI